jgi:isoquinoline 1-oxidoreductase beta subunit
MNDTTMLVDRRSFLKVTALAGGGVVIGLYSPSLAQQGPGGGAAPWSLAATDYITVHPDNTFSIIAKNPETGQGIRHALPQLIADEFDVDWSQVKIVQADLDPKYGPQVEGGSRATPVNYDPMRQVGAGGRLMMITAAAQMWNVPAGELTTGRGVVTHAGSKRTATYASLASRVAAMAPPAAEAVRAAYKSPANFSIIGKPIKGVDNLAIVTGQPAFSIDVEPEGTLCAVYEKCPVFGGRAVSANLDDIKRLPGIRHAFVVDAVAGPGSNSMASGVAIVADHFWLANNARRTLKVVWDEGPVAAQSTAGYTAQARRLAAERASVPPSPPPAGRGGRGGGAGGGTAIGDVEAAFKSAARVIEADYYFPLLSHAPLEPQNSLAHYKADGSLEVWSCSQTPALAHPARGAGIEPSKVTMHLVRAGGGFGRRLANDYDVEVGKIARLVSEERIKAGLPTVPVKLVWTREDDMAHDQYRPAGYHFFKAGLDASGKLVAFRDFVASASSVVPANEFPRGFVENFQVASAPIAPFDIPTGALRAPGTNGVSFVMQSFIDEIAVAAGKDPLQYRLDLLASPVAGAPTPGGFNAARARGVLEAVRDMSDWNNRGRLPSGTGKGVAFQFAHAGYVAYVVEATVGANKRVVVNRAWCAVDVGRQIINPLHSTNLVQGGFIEAMSHMMAWQITIEKGRVVQTNFNAYQPTRMNQAPASIEVRFLETDFDPTGLGEPALPPAIPAIANAIFAATGARIRSVPFAEEGYAWT